MTDRSWFLLESGLGGPYWNMALDEALFESAANLGRPVLRFYGWTEPAATFGYFQRCAEVSGWTPLRPLVRRITGGGLVPHDADWTYSLVFPPDHPWAALSASESYRRLHEWVAEAFASVNLPAQLAPCCEKPAPGRCFVGAEKFDVLSAGRKIAGAAQKRNKHGLLIQGSVQPGSSGISRDSWQNAMISGQLVEWQLLDLPPAMHERAKFLEAFKYATAQHNERR